MEEADKKEKVEELPTGLSVNEMLRYRLKQQGKPLPPRAVDFLNDEVMEDGATVMHSFAHRAITVLPGDIVKKWSNISLEHEVHTLRLAEAAGLPVPHVHGIGVSPKKKNWFAMDHVKGRTLTDAWEAYSPHEKRSVVRQLHDILMQMRAMVPPADHIGGPRIGDNAHDLITYNVNVYPASKSEAEFNARLVNSMTAPVPVAHAVSDQLAATTHRIVFSHGDLAMRNIIVDGPNIAGLIDWELGGWYPEYWDYAKFLSGIRVSDFFDYAEDIFPQTYPQELVLSLAIRSFQ